MDQVLLRAEEVAQALNVGRSKAYELMASGQLPVVRIGRSVRVPAKGFQEWLEARLDATAGGADRSAEHQQGAADDEAGRFLWCVDPEAAVSPGRDEAALCLKAGAIAQTRMPATQGEPVTHD